MSGKVPTLPLEELQAMHTGSLMRRRKMLLQCQQSSSNTDLINGPVTPGIIAFKDTLEWKQAYDELKSVLQTREHWPTKKERKAARQAKAK